MTKWDTVAVVGAGLIGGSVGLALLTRGLAREVIGIGRRPSTLERARQCGAVTHTTTELARGVANAQLTIVCTPVELVVQHVRDAAEHCPPAALLTDVGSTKQQIVEQLDGQLPRDVRFVGSHPLAGSDKSGPEHARADLFQDRLVVVTPGGSTRAEDLETIEQFWQSLGARTARMAPAEHDQAVASTSHVPHVAAAALAAATPDWFLPLAATGWRDTTRVAGGDPELWRQILADNRQHVLQSLEQLQRELTAFQTALEENDQKRLLQLLEAGKQKRDSVGS